MMKALGVSLINACKYASQKLTDSAATAAPIDLFLLCRGWVRSSLRQGTVSQFGRQQGQKVILIVVAQRLPDEGRSGL